VSAKVEYIGKDGMKSSAHQMCGCGGAFLHQIEINFKIVKLIDQLL
jgi:hypothetical protein